MDGRATSTMKKSRTIMNIPASSTGNGPRPVGVVVVLMGRASALPLREGQAPLGPDTRRSGLHRAEL